MKPLPLFVVLQIQVLNFNPCFRRFLLLWIVIMLNNALVLFLFGNICCCCMCFMLHALLLNVFVLRLLDEDFVISMWTRSAHGGWRFFLRAMVAFKSLVAAKVVDAQDRKSFLFVIFFIWHKERERIFLSVGKCLMEA